ncbi:MAG: Rpn family recombination-promoting nuclease/putative transposase [Candidatus Parabeggiatoa sp.]|nr:Rpn family recombination-promoting nuclease/putative transposase [Candidatus Parabeggiatoa sp.]
MAKKITIHDSGYKHLFSNKVIFRQLIETFVTEEWVKDLDFESSQKIDKSFISEHYKETESDIIYQVNFRGKKSYLIILIEFQSTVPRFMAVRVLNYLTNFYMDYLKSNKGVKKLPPIFPIVLYNGDKSWTAPVNLANLIENNDLLGKYGLSFEYFKIAINEYSKETLLKFNNIVSTLFLAEGHYDIDLLEKELIELFQRESDKQAVSLFLNWFKQLAVHDRIDERDYSTLHQIYANTQEVNMLMTSIREERKRLYDGGFKDGKNQGRHAEKRAMVETLLYKGMDISFIAEVTQLSEEEILKLKVKH